MTAFEQLLDWLKADAEAFWAQTRYVIHGKPDSARFGDQVWGFGIVPEDSDRVYIWNDRAAAEEYLADRMKESPDKTVPPEFEIRKVHESELRTTYLKARIIG